MDEQPSLEQRARWDRILSQIPAAELDKCLEVETSGFIIDMARWGLARDVFKRRYWRELVVEWLKINT